LLTFKKKHGECHRYLYTSLRQMFSHFLYSHHFLIRRNAFIFY
jgi:hypothetical protein